MIQGKVLAFLALQIALATCQSSNLPSVKTISGEYCVFPFIYKGVMYESCTFKNHDHPWCSTTSNYDKDRKWGNCAVYPSPANTTTGKSCVFPFIYKGVTYKSCTTKYYYRPWCSTTANYDQDMEWGNCEGYTSSWVLTTCIFDLLNNCEWGQYCVFPFTYKGVTYDSCITQDHDRPWCSTTASYDQDRKWGSCAW